MAENKETEIVFEYPDDEIPGTKVSEEKEVFTQTEKNEVKVETKADDIDLEIYSRLALQTPQSVGDK